MKRRTIIVMVAVSSFFILSCKKDYSCNCTTYTSDPSTGSAVESDDTFTLNTTEKDAEIWCSGKSTSTLDPSGGIPSSVTTCELAN